MPFERRSALLCRAFGWRSAFQPGCDPLASSLGLSALEDRLRKGDGFRPAVNSEINCIYISTPSNRHPLDPRRRLCYRHMFAYRRAPGPANPLHQGSSCQPSSSAESISSNSIPCSPTTNAWSATPRASSSKTTSFPSSRSATAPAASRANWSSPWRDLGFFGASLKGYGCAGMSNVEYGLVMQELERGDSGVRSLRQRAVGAGACIPFTPSAATSRNRPGCPRMQKGEKLGCFGLTEPDFGSNPGGMRTRAKKSARNTSSTARRCGSPPAPSPTSPIIWAKVEDEDDKIRGFLVETDRPGFTRRRHSRQVVAARFGHVRPVAAGRAHPGIEPAAQDRRPEVSADVPEPGALRHRAGARSARPWPATTARCSIRCSASSSAISPSPRTSWCRKSWPG